ncbi:unnamed protein product [Sphenostylis stenocarpa]|uniref:Uncharacterized protein n=1 Tax=Sphenostylis stenocarpa TaxID=92480 RepID=A0AA86W681_9FABA|nr:unnamed protein product [Sphenostylis stenocarpa]
MEDASNPLFFHHSDGPGLSLNKLGFIDSSLPQPTADDPNLAVWFHYNNVSVWEELTAFKPVCSCSCGEIRPLLENFATEHAIQEEKQREIGMPSTSIVESPHAFVVKVLVKSFKPGKKDRPL